MPSNTSRVSAEESFRKAFERLKEGKPTLLKPGSIVSQNNVAKEAGCDPSALRKNRYPSLIREIKAFVELNGDERPSKRKAILKQRAAKSVLKDRLAEVMSQRDNAQSQLLSAQRRIVELTIELGSAKKQLEAFQPPPAPIRHRG